MFAMLLEKEVVRGDVGEEGKPALLTALHCTAFLPARQSQTKQL
jgi:hypothetical protein